MTDRPQLSLDIGTRKVVGLLTVPSQGGLKILAAEKVEHSTRAMYDGQIHDVQQVASVVRSIVQRLEAKAKIPLNEAAVAAAGRALRTFRGTAGRSLTGLTELTQEAVFALELEAVQAAQAAMASALEDREHPLDYHYVGHSVAGTRLDGLAIANLVGQRGTQADLDVIATFLPRGVVDSLQAVLSVCGLEMTGLTLEPIAALTVAVPQTMRHLNLVLVDIGAGTSDIAITSKGSVIAFDMVPIAGDEITEALSEAYLLDFTVGESVKRQLGSRERIQFADILGHKLDLPSEELIQSFHPAVARLAEEIAQRVLSLNGGPPQAIMLVGGGSMTPGLPATLAAKVGLPESRVAVRDREAVSGVEGEGRLLGGPDAITPIGIAVASRSKSTLGFHLVHVDGRSVRLFHPSNLTVADALLAAGISIRELQGRVGKGLTLSVNGNLHIVRGTFGRPAQILVNGQPAKLESPIVHRDSITVIPGTEGEPGKATVASVAPAAADRLEIIFNGEPCRLDPLILVNGDPAGPDRELQDNDTVVVRASRTVGDALFQLGFGDPDVTQQIRFTLDGAVQVLHRPHYAIRLNGGECTADVPLRNGDSLEVEAVPPLTIREVAAASMTEPATIRVWVNGEPMELEAGGFTEIRRNGRPADPDSRVTDNDVITIAGGVGGEGPLFAHLLAKSHIATSPPKGKTSLVMLINGNLAEFVTPLQEGDRVELRWE